MIFRSRERQLRADIRQMNTLVDAIVSERKTSREPGKPDLLNVMLSGVDKKSSEGLDDVNIRHQIITFLIAGHETTSGLLSFAIYYLLNHPDVLARCSEEVDQVLGADLSARPTYLQVNRLAYVSQVLKETLRLSPTAPAFAVTPYEDTVIGGHYAIKKGQHVSILLPMLHRDRTVWGERAEVFDPDNFSPDAEKSRPPNCYKPFGSGQRTCIGQQFAMHEAALVLGMILQRFDLVGDAGYELRLQETLTIKPACLRIKVRPRERQVAPPQAASSPGAPTPAPPPIMARHGTRLLVLYGSNMGSSEEIARKVAQDGEAAGFATSLAPLDDYAGRLPAEGLVAVASASYNGTPPDNAVAFCQWLSDDKLPAGALNGVRYTVFGCGNRDWAATFQAIPRLIDARLAALGARRIYRLGEGDARDDFDGQFQSWYKSLWTTAAGEFGLKLGEPSAASREPLYAIEYVARQPNGGPAGHSGGVPMVVRINRELQSPADAGPPERSTRHIEIELPAGVSYRAGDHFGVVPRNDPTLIRRVASRFGVDPNARLKLHQTGTRPSFLPVGRWISLGPLLGEHVELQDVATRGQIQMLADHTESPATKHALTALAGEDEAFRTKVLVPRVSVLDLLDEFPACALPLNVFLELLPPLAPRYYSISSSPLASPAHCAITVAIVDAPARSGHGGYKGVCSNYLARRSAGDEIEGFAKDTKSHFRLPAEPRLPIIMIGPGTGLAPFRGFLQERAALKARGEPVGRAMLFFGCRHPSRDFIYEAELRAFAEHGVAELHTAFSRVDAKTKSYVQDRLLAAQDDVWALIEAGARIYICGDATKMAPDVRRALVTVCMAKTGADAERAEHWLGEMTAADRCLVDVWASS